MQQTIRETEEKCKTITDKTLETTYSLQDWLVMKKITYIATHLVTFPRWMGHRECESPDVLWVVARR